MPSSRMRLAGALVLGLVGSTLAVGFGAPAHAANDHLVINEVYGGGGSTSTSPTPAYKVDFVELYNPTSGPLSTNGLSLQYRSATFSSTTPPSALELPNASVAAGDTFLVQVSPPNGCSGGVTCTGADLPTPDFTATTTLLNMAGTAGQVILAQGTTGITVTGNSMHTVTGVVDFVGYGTTPTSSETARTGAALTTTTSAQRKTVPSPGVDTDNNSADFAAPATPSPTKSSSATPVPLDAAPVADKSGTVGQPITRFSLAASGGTTPYSWSVTGLPSGVVAGSSGAVSGTPMTAGTYSVTATVTDGATPTPATDTVGFTFTVAGAPDIKPIAEIQGNDVGSPLAGETVTTEGVVTGMYADVSWAGASSGYDGMYIQTAGTGGATDTTLGRSDAIFVWGNQSMPAGVAIGDSVSVTGRVSEFAGTTEITPSTGGVVELGTALDPVTALEIAYPTTEAGREAQEGMLLAPTDTFTVTDSYSTNGTGEVGLATGTTPLKQPTEFARPSDTAGIQAIKDDNQARGVMLDDGTSISYQQNATNKGQPVPYLTSADGSPNPIRVGAKATLQSPVILEFRSNGSFSGSAEWRLQPQSPVFLNGADVATFEDTRAQNLRPQDVGGDLTIATFNVLNYFNTTGEAYVAAGQAQNPPINTHCTYYSDRASNRIGNNQCGVKQPGETYTSGNPNDGRGPRGAATAASLARQEEKLANTINALDADVIGLEEVENSIKLPGETNRDDALARIVEILNADAGEAKWAYVRSPGESLTAAAVGEQDVIRGAFIYQRDSVETVGQSDLLLGTTQFANAREPLAQAFKSKGAPDGDAFAVIVNHFKSKGDNANPAPPASGDNTADDVTGVGAFNGDRVRQAHRLVQFADDFAADRDIEAVFLAGDFNSYTMEEPIQVLEENHFALVESDDPNDESYSYQGRSGSLDHVLGNEAAMAMVEGVDIWEINADESSSFQYSRHNYNVTNFWQPNLPFGTSDHNPEIVGIDTPDFTATTYREIQILGTNDFHGRLLPDGGNAAGAAPFATAVQDLKDQVPDSIFVAAGDLVGASTFESFVQEDNPTIDALNAMDLEVSAAGNHEFDRGYDDFVGRIQDRANWEYIAANVNEPAGQDELAETFTKTFGTGEDAIEVGFVGAVTEDLLALVNPDGMTGVTVSDVVDATNAAAADLKADGADLVVLLVHEGSPTTECSSPNFTDEATTWGNIVQNTSSDVDAIVSGHTHLAYNCRYPVADWATDGRAVTKRPVVSAGQYGTNLNQLVFKFDETTGELAGVTQDVVATAGVGHAADADVQTIVDAAVAYAAERGDDVLGTMDGPFKRAQYLPASGATENRGGESTLGNQVAEVQRWATDEAGIDTDIAFMNPGGLRADMVGAVNGDVRDLTYRQAADVQPFANTLVNMRLTGAQLETVLEEQWQRNAQGGVPSRPFLRLGVSEGFTYSYEESPETVNAPNSAPVDTFRGEVTGMWLDGEPIDPTETYGVTVNSFLATGGDNFWELADGTGKVDSGKVDLEAMVDYMERYDAANPLAVDYSQRAVEISFPGAAPDVYTRGDHVTFDVASWAMSAPGDAEDSAIDVQLDGESIGSAALDNAVGAQPYDNSGTATIDVVLPATAPDGKVTLMLVGAATGTEVPVVINTTDGLPDSTVSADDASMVIGQAGTVEVTVRPDTATGTVSVRDGADVLGSAPLDAGSATVTIPANSLDVGEHELTLVYSGSSENSPSAGTVTMTVAQAESVTTATVTPAEVVVRDGVTTVKATVSAAGYTPTGLVEFYVDDALVTTQWLTAGEATTQLAPFQTTGTRSITVRYLGDTHTLASASTGGSVTVVKATPTMAITTNPERVTTKVKQISLTAALSAPGQTVTGQVRIAWKKKTATQTLSGGSTTFSLGGYDEAGSYDVQVTYLGSTTAESVTRTYTIVVHDK